MTTEVRQIHIRKDGAWQPVPTVKIRKDGAWKNVQGVFHAGSWHVVEKLDTKKFTVLVNVNIENPIPISVGKCTITTEP